jgi:multidrug efflux pump subunit AcrA (membrane-fusion protein)
VNQTNKIEKRSVTVGIQGSDNSEILSGIKDGERVIVSAQSNYQVGEVVRPKAALQFSQVGGQQ